MEGFSYVKADDIKTFEQYAASLLASMASLRTLEHFQRIAFNEGLLKEDDAELATTIIWEIQRLLMLYKQQLTNILEVTPLPEKKLLDHLKKMMPEMELPKKRRAKRSGKAMPESH